MITVVPGNPDSREWGVRILYNINNYYDQEHDVLDVDVDYLHREFVRL